MAIAFVASTKTTGTSAGINTSAANLIVAVSMADSASPAPTDSNGNTWTSLTVRPSGGALTQCRLHYVLNPTVGSGHTFSISSGEVYITAFSGVASYDQESGSSAVQPGAITPAADNALLVAGVRSPTDVTAVDSGFTLQEADTGGFPLGGGIAYLIQGAAASVNPTFTVGVGDKATAMASFLATPPGADTGGKLGIHFEGSHRPAPFAPGRAR
jgi:hypothetical protein